MKIAPSMLACDFTRIGDELIKMSEANADMIHQDIMDGNFVPNISFGSAIVKAMRPLSDIFFDVHLMIHEPMRYIEDYVDAGADNITFHIEGEKDIDGTIDKIREMGVKASLSVKPKTSIQEVYPYLDKLYMVLIMTVEPGFGGQSFMPDMMDKVRVLKEEIKKRGLDVLIQVDGGINSKTIHFAADAGVDVCVAGTGVFKAQDAAEAIKELQSV